MDEKTRQLKEAYDGILQQNIIFEEENERLKSNDDMYVQLDKTNEQLREKLEKAKKILKYTMDNINGYCYMKGDCENCNTKSCPYFAIDRCLTELTK